MHFASRLLRPASALALSSALCCSCSPTQRAARTLEQAHAYYQAGELEKAEIEFKNVLQDDAQNIDAIAHLGLLYHDQGRDARAAAYLLRARELQPENLAVRLRLGLAHLAAGGHAEARDEALYILQRRPDDPQAPLLLVEASTTPRDVEDARRRLELLPALASQSPAVLVALGNIALRQNRVADAETSFNAALARDPNFVAAHGSLGVLHWSRKDHAAADAAFKRAAELAPPRSPKRLHYAQFKLQSGDTAAARSFLEEMGRQTPDYIPVWVWLTEIALKENKIDDADAFIAKALARESLHAEAMLLNARVRMAKGDTEKAVTELERLIGMFPRSPQIAYQLGLAHAAAGDNGKAIARLTQAIAAAPDFVQAAVAMGELHLRQRDYTSAIATLKPVVEKNPSHIGAHVFLAEAHRAQGNLDDAAAIYSQLQTRLPRDAQLAFARATVLLQQNKLADARAEFARARELNPNHLGALEQLVEFDLRDKKPAAARSRVDAELAKSPSSVQLTLLLAKVCAAQGDTAGIEAALEKAVELQPGSVVALYQLARLYVTSNRVDAAIARFQDAARLNPKNLTAHLLLGVLLDQRADHTGARDSYEKALAIDPKNTLALNNLAYLYSERFDQLDQALELAQRARNLLPSEPRTADTLGWILVKKKSYPQAISLLQESAARLPDEAEIHYHLGVAHYMAGDESAAKTALHRAIERNPTFAAADDARRRLTLLELDPARAGSETRALLDKRVAEQPDDPIALLRLAELTQRTGSPDDAIARYQAVLRANPANASALLGLARLHAAKKQFEKALEFAKSARSASPGDPAITHTLGRLAYDTGDHRWAASLLQELARDRADDPEVLFDWAESAYSVGRVADAETSLRRAIELDHTFSRAAAAKRFLALLSLAAQPDQAVAASARVEQALQADPASAPALFARAIILERKADRSAAQKTYTALLERHPEFSPAQRNLVVLLAADAGPVAKNASSLATKARQSFPQDHALNRAAGIIAFRSGEFTRALSLLQPAAEKNTGDSETLYYLGMTQWRLEKRDDARKSLQRALELGLDEALATEARRSLASSE